MNIEIKNHIILLPMKKRAELSLVLPPMPSLRRVISRDSQCELQKALHTHLHQNSGMKQACNQMPDNSTKWFESPLETLAEMIKLLHRMEKSGKWIRNLKD
jgi:hypothetical protein